MSRNWSLDIGLFVLVCLAILAGGYFFRSVDRLPELHLHHSIEAGSPESRWEELYGKDSRGNAPDGEESRASLQEQDGMIVVTSPGSVLKSGVELVFADSEGSFEGSWCRGKLGFASLVLPQVNTKGRLSLKWSIPLYDIRGEKITGEAAELLKGHLNGSRYLGGRSSEPYVDYEVERYASPAVVALLTIEDAALPWSSEGFSCFDAGNRFDSESSHALQTESAVVGEAEMFTWHRAAMRLSWDLQGKGNLTTAEIPLQENSSFQCGGFRFDVLGVKVGIFHCQSMDRKAARGTPLEFLRSESPDQIRTCFLATNLHGRSILRVEAKDGAGAWKELTFAAQDNGVISVELGSGLELDKSALRITWKPRTMRVVVDVPGIGGSLPENEGVTLYNEIRFPLYGATFENNGMSWRLWQLLGSYPRIKGENFDPSRAPGTRAEPGKLYRADDLYRSWQRMNPDLRFHFDRKQGAIVIEDR